LDDVFAQSRSRNKGKRILLIADQFEEAFTLVPDDTVRNDFIDVLLARARRARSDPITFMRLPPWRERSKRQSSISLACVVEYATTGGGTWITSRT